MFEVGDRIVTDTTDTLTGLLGTVVKVPNSYAVHVLLDEDRHKKGDWGLYFSNLEVWKVDA
jgi:hypothetical protein